MQVRHGGAAGQHLAAADRPRERWLMATYRGPGQKGARETEIRDRAMTRLIYAAEMKVIQACNMERHHYQRGGESITIPATGNQPQRTFVLDPLRTHARDRRFRQRVLLQGPRVRALHRLPARVRARLHTPPQPADQRRHRAWQQGQRC
jgi:hypothetical protein